MNTHAGAGFRPLVRLNSNVKLKAVDVDSTDAFELGFEIAG